MAGFYINDITQINRLYQAAKSLIAQIDKTTLTDDHGHNFERNIALISFRKVLAEVEGSCTNS